MPDYLCATHLGLAACTPGRPAVTGMVDNPGMGKEREREAEQQKKDSNTKKGDSSVHVHRMAQ